ncbi:hypothetical protein CPB86DRAFT_116064 [Serendipita vermifera]|nr:hypothetical protein CPB86DRAFT_116064 [Serendipita vermifera]
MDGPESPLCATQAEPDNTERIQWYGIGMRFSYLGRPHETSDKSIHMKHWTVVFSSLQGSSMHHTVEIFPNLKANVAIRHERHQSGPSSHVVAAYKGAPDDIERVLEAHPMRRTQYTPCFNNCQHFAAAFLLLLHVYANEKPNRTFEILDEPQLCTVLSVLKAQGSKLYHQPNILFQLGEFSHFAISGGIAVGLSQAAEAIVTYTVPASGLAGWFGATTSAVAPAAYASFAAAVAPVATAATVGVGVAYLWQRNSWRKKSMFDDPLRHGFPQGRRRLNPVERIQVADLEGKQGLFLLGKFTSSISSKVDGASMEEGDAVSQSRPRE